MDGDDQGERAPTEPSLVALAQAGSTTAFARLVDLYQGPVRAFLRRLARSPADADDLAQEVFVDAWLGIERFERGRSFRAWLFGLAYRKHLAGRRSMFRRLRRESFSVSGASSTDLPHARAEAEIDLARLMAALPDEQRAVVALCLVDEFSHAEAAQILSLPLGTVKSHVARGKARLLAMLGERA